MLVYQAPYRDWIGPYQIAEALCFWVPKTKDELGNEEFPEWVDNFGEWLSETPLLPLCNWIEENIKRIVHVHIDKYDTWNMDSTLTPIILPLLKQLKESQHGAPHVDDCDVPDNLKSSAAPEKQNDWDIDDLHFARWDWVLNEMIWAFNELNGDWENQFHTGNIDFQFEKDPETGHNLLIHGPNHTGKFDSDGYTTHLNRIKRGTTLFGKYFQNLWD